MNYHNTIVYHKIQYFYIFKNNEFLQKRIHKYLYLMSIQIINYLNINAAHISTYILIRTI